MMANVWPCIVSMGYVFWVGTLTEVSSMTTLAKVSNFSKSSRALIERQAETLGMHMH